MLSIFVPLLGDTLFCRLWQTLSLCLLGVGCGMLRRVLQLAVSFIVAHRRELVETLAKQATRELQMLLRRGGGSLQDGIPVPQIGDG